MKPLQMLKGRDLKHTCILLVPPHILRESSNNILVRGAAVENFLDASVSSIEEKSQLKVWEVAQLFYGKKNERELCSLLSCIGIYVWWFFFFYIKPSSRARWRFKSSYQNFNQIHESFMYWTKRTFLWVLTFFFFF